MLLRRVSQLNIHPCHHCYDSQGSTSSLTLLKIFGFLIKGTVVEVYFRNGYITIGPRTLMELKGYLLAQFPGAIRECMHCGEIVTVGVSCPNQDCLSRMHRKCFNIQAQMSLVKRTNRQQSSLVCSACDSPIPIPAAVEN